MRVYERVGCSPSGWCETSVLTGRLREAHIYLTYFIPFITNAGIYENDSLIRLRSKIPLNISSAVPHISHPPPPELWGEGGHCWSVLQPQLSRLIFMHLRYIHETLCVDHVVGCVRDMKWNVCTCPAGLWSIKIWLVFRAHLFLASIFSVDPTLFYKWGHTFHRL